MNERIKNILKQTFNEALTLPIDKLDQVDPMKLDKIADKTDVVIGEDNTSVIDPTLLSNLKTILFSIISEEGVVDASFYLAAKLPISATKLVHLFDKPTWGENLDALLKPIPVADLERFYQEEKARLQPVLNETVSGDEVLEPGEVMPGMQVYAEYDRIGTAIEATTADDWAELLRYDSTQILPSEFENSEIEAFYDKFSPDDYLIAVDLGDGETVVGAYSPNDFYCIKDTPPSKAPDDVDSTPRSSQGPDIEVAPMTEESQFPTATPEQQQAMFDLQTWASELGLDIGVGEDTVGDIIKFGFEGAEGWQTILVDPNGNIKVSGHAIKTFDDFQDIVSFFQD